jgi:methylenetetrahydrofolate dehydrogenase (NADP+)/methenyltetrahydrofolate cyclohydrolase
VILVGSDPASSVYVHNKIRACAEVGIKSFRCDLPETVDTQAVVSLIGR